MWSLFLTETGLCLCDGGLCRGGDRLTGEDRLLGKLLQKGLSVFAVCCGEAAENRAADSEGLKLRISLYPVCRTVLLGKRWREFVYLQQCSERTGCVLGVKGGFFLLEFD